MELAGGERRQIRETCVTPILILSARGSDTDKVLGLGFGADDETFEVAFPIVGQAAQIGNAIFTLPASLVLPDRPSAPLLFPIMLVFACVLLVIALLLHL